MESFWRSDDSWLWGRLWNHFFCAPRQAGLVLREYQATLRPYPPAVTVHQNEALLVWVIDEYAGVGEEL